MDRSRTVQSTLSTVHHDRLTHEFFDLQISKELPSSTVGEQICVKPIAHLVMCSIDRQAGRDISSQFKSAINDLNTLIEHVESFADWWGDMTIRLTNLEETLPNVKV